MSDYIQEIMEEWEKEFVKPYWENHNRVRFNEPSLTWSSNDTELIRKQKVFLSQALTRVEEAAKEKVLKEIIQHNFDSELGTYDYDGIAEEALLSHKKDTGEHKIGKHGAVGYMTQKGRVCTECGKSIEEEK